MTTYFVEICIILEYLYIIIYILHKYVRGVLKYTKHPLDNIYNYQIKLSLTLCYNL